MVTTESVLGAQVFEVHAGPARGERLRPRLLPPWAEQPEQAVPALAAERLPGVRPEVRALGPGAAPGRSCAVGEGRVPSGPGALRHCPVWPARAGRHMCPCRAGGPLSQPSNAAEGAKLPQTIHEQAGRTLFQHKYFQTLKCDHSVFTCHVMNCCPVNFFQPRANVKPFLAGGSSPCQGPRPPCWPLTLTGPAASVPTRGAHQWPWLSLWTELFRKEGGRQAKNHLNFCFPSWVVPREITTECSGPPLEQFCFVF